MIGPMKISPWPGSTTSGTWSGQISNPTTSITEFEIKGFGQTQYQSCVQQNANFWQCELSGTLVEPASVRLNGGAYEGCNIIVSMSESSAEYPLSSCSTGSSYTEDENNKGNINTALIAVIVIGCLMVLFCVGLLCLYKYKQNRGRAYFEESKRNVNANIGAFSEDSHGGGNDDTADTNGGSEEVVC